MTTITAQHGEHADEGLVLEDFELKNWRAFVAIQVGEPKRQLHVAGTVIATGEGRVSSELVDFDPSSMSGHTQSGRRYVLVGEPSLDHVGQDAFKRWCYQIGASTEDISVTLEDTLGQLGLPER
ncbi:hypothetical protein BH09PSE6_BH09PSE6_21120 [soil metagenome]